MTLKPHKHRIVNTESWKQICPPKKGDAQWRDGRSAKELAKYITGSLPAVPTEIENALAALIPSDASFDWDAEYVTPLPGTGEGRNHDAVFYNDQLLVTIEAKVDETLGNLVEEELQNASVNKLQRVGSLLGMLFQGGFKDYRDLRYQLLTAATGTLIEADRLHLSTAVMIVLVFKSSSDVNQEKLDANHKDVADFLTATGAYDESGFKVIPNHTNIKLYFKEIVVHFHDRGDNTTPKPDDPHKAPSDKEREVLMRRFEAIMESNKDVFRRLAEDD